MKQMKQIAFYLFCFAFGCLIGTFNESKHAATIGFVGGIIFSYIQFGFHFGKILIESWKSNR